MPAERVFRAAQSLITLFLLGGLYAMAVFTVPLDADLPSVWPSAIGLMHWLSAPITILTGLSLQASTNRSTTARRLGSLASLCYLGFALAATRVAWLVRVAVCLQAVPLGVNYLLHCEILVAWFRDAPGAVVGAGLMCYNAGTIVLSWVFTQLLKNLTLPSALVTTGVLLAVPSLLPAMFLSFPPCAISSPMSQQNQGTHASPTALHVARTPQFWLYVGAVLSTGAPYALLPFFFTVGQSPPFSLPSNHLLIAFQLTGVAGTALALVTGVACDALSSALHTAGARIVLAGALLLQVVLFGLLLVSPAPAAFYVGAGGLVALMNCHYGAAAVLAAQVFGEADGPAAFGLGAGLAIGGGEGASAQAMGMVEWMGREGYLGGVKEGGGYRWFYAGAIGWTLAGLACVAGLRPRRIGEDRAGVEHSEVESVEKPLLIDELPR